MSSLPQVIFPPSVEVNTLLSDRIISKTINGVITVSSPMDFQDTINFDTIAGNTIQIGSEPILSQGTQFGNPSLNSNAQFVSNGEAISVRSGASTTGFSVGPSDSNCLFLALITTPNAFALLSNGSVASNLLLVDRDTADMTTFGSISCPQNITSSLFTNSNYVDTYAAVTRASFTPTIVSTFYDNITIAAGNLDISLTSTSNPDDTVVVNTTGFYSISMTTNFFNQAVLPNQGRTGIITTIFSNNDLIDLVFGVVCTQSYSMLVPLSAGNTIQFINQITNADAAVRTDFSAFIVRIG